MSPSAEKNSMSLFSRDFLLVALLVTLINIISMPREQVPGDSNAARCETIALLKTGSLAVPEEMVKDYGSQGQWFFKNEATGRWYSKYGILNTLIYIPVLYAEKAYRGHLDYESFDGRVLFLNSFNILFALATAAYLFKFAGLYTSSLFTKAAYILAVFYSTFWWDHLRIQAFEAYQPFFLIGACYHLIRACNAIADPAGREKIPRRDLFCAGLLLGLLWLSKSSYILIAPLFAMLVVIFEWKHIRHNGDFLASRLRWCAKAYGVYLGLPLLTCFAALLAVNAYKFGSPLNNGYTQWVREKDLWTGNIVDGVTGFLFDPQFSIFITFPVLVIALFGLPGFIRNHGRDALVIYSVSILLLLLNAKFLNWRGVWSYGPRYMLPALGMMSLPFVPAIERIAGNIKKPWGMGAALLIILILGYSARLQMNVNALRFYSYFYIREKIIDPLGDGQLNDYFNNRHFGLIAADMLAYKHGRPLWFRDRVEKLANDRRISAVIDAGIARCCESNYYFFSDNDK